MKHTCHTPICRASCPPRHLMCGPCWALVPVDLQDRVYATVKRRGKSIDATWAPWWRAAHQAIAAVLKAKGSEFERVDRWLDKEMCFAASLETPEARP